MSRALHYQEPKRVAAGMLAMTVHVVFLLLLMFGVRWQNRAPDSFAVELWQSLPMDEVVVTNEPVPATASKQETTSPPKQEELPASPPPVTPQAEIELRDKKATKKTPTPTERQGVAPPTAGGSAALAGRTGRATPSSRAGAGAR